MIPIRIPGFEKSIFFKKKLRELEMIHLNLGLLSIEVSIELLHD